MKKRVVLWMLHDVVSMVEIRSENERLWGVKSLRKRWSAWRILRQKASWVVSGSGDGRAEKPRYDVPRGLGVKNRYEAELTNQRRGSGSKPLGVFCCAARWRGMVAVYRFLSSALLTL